MPHFGPRFSHCERFFSRHTIDSIAIAVLFGPYSQRFPFSHFHLIGWKMGDYRSRRWQDAKKGYLVMLSASLSP
jgi:hypothetical protein